MHLYLSRKLTLPSAISDNTLLKISGTRCPFACLTAVSGFAAGLPRNYFVMQTDEKKLTRAQKKLLSVCSHLEADNMYEQLSTTLSLAIVNYLSVDETAYPTRKALEAWYFTLELMDRLHAIAVEERKAVTRESRQ